MATLFMLGLLHARRLYDDNQLEVVRDEGIEIEFSPDAKASFLRLLPLRSISRVRGFITDVEYPTWLRPYIYKAWARAFLSGIDVGLSLCVILLHFERCWTFSLCYSVLFWSFTLRDMLLYREEIVLG
ncbi:hypothetical protein MKX01_033578 [Papaver californicum]|nr:hypothetical protein MKX01_033578 [Papaver californicum]